MKAFFLSIFGILLMWNASAYEDRYLYWMVGQPIDDAYRGFDAVRVMARYNGSDGSDRWLTLYSSDSNPLTLNSDGTLTIDYEQTSAIAQSSLGLYAALAEGMGADNYTYVIELFKNGNCFAESAPLSAAKEYLAIADGGTIRPGTLQMPTSYAVPEPNSALLMVLGCAALALRRRKQTKA